MHRVLVLNDTHVGSVWGLWPPNYESHYGNVEKMNEIQKELYKHWKKFSKKVAKRKIKTVILLGDMVDGPGYKSRGREQMVTDMRDQVSAAGQLLYPLLKEIQPENVYVFSGSDYHSASQQNSERDLALDLGAEYVGLGPHDFEFDDIDINFSHGSGSSYWYRGTKMDKMGFSMQLSMAGPGLYNAKHIVRGHFHYEGYLHYSFQDIYISPCWQAQTDYMRKKNPMKMIPDIGSLELTVDKGNVSPRFYHYEHPPRPKRVISGVDVRPDSWPKFRYR
jgi:hypothetical protein